MKIIRNILFAVAAVAAIGLAVANARPGNGVSPGCIHDCNDARRECEDREDTFHAVELARCSLIPDPVAQDECKRREHARHQAALHECIVESQQCKKACHD